MRICIGVAALSVWAAVSGMAAAPERITSTVHADLRTGKLVRSVIVAARPVSRRSVAETVVQPAMVQPAMVQPAVVSNAVAAAPPPPASNGIDEAAGIDEAVERIAAQHSLPAQLIHSVIKVESNYNPFALSPKGAQGLMQLIPATARRFGVSDSFNPVDNIQGGARYLKYLLELYNGNYPLALAAYNAGEAAVAKYRGVPPFTETRNYLILVRKQLESAKKIDAARLAARETKSAEPVPGATAHIQELIQPDGTVRYVVR